MFLVLIFEKFALIFERGLDFDNEEGLILKKYPDKILRRDLVKIKKSR